MRTKIYFSIAAFLLISFSAFAQLDSMSRARTRGDFRLMDKLVFGGNLGLQFGSQSLVDVSPIVGYKLTDRLVPGVGATFRYMAWRIPGYQPVRANFYGGSVWTRFYFIPQIFAHIEYEALNGEWSPYTRPGYRYFLSTPFLGGGYSQGNGIFSSYIMLLYILNYDYNSPYGSPLVMRVGFTIGI